MFGDFSTYYNVAYELYYYNKLYLLYLVLNYKILYIFFLNMIKKLKINKNKIKIFTENLFIYLFIIYLYKKK